MDFIQLQQIHAINNAKQQQLLGKIVLYSMLLACSLFCFSLLWFPDILCPVKLFLFASLPKVGAVLFSSKFIFFVGNLIVIVLVGESKLFASSSPSASDVYYNEYMTRKRSMQSSSALEEKTVRKVEKSVTEKASGTSENRVPVERNLEVVKETDYLDGENELSQSDEELNKRADDFIARVNRQIRLEARAVVCYGK